MFSFNINRYIIIIYFGEGIKYFNNYLNEGMQTFSNGQSRLAVELTIILDSPEEQNTNLQTIRVPIITIIIVTVFTKIISLSKMEIRKKKFVSSILRLD